MAETNLQREFRMNGLTQKSFCEEYGVSEGTVSGWMKNKRAISAKHVNILRSLKIKIEAIKDPGGIDGQRKS